MQVKVCYQKEIHKLSKCPKDFTALLHSLKTIFSKDLPEKFTLQYEDSDGDKIVLANNEDYQMAVDAENSKSLKIFLVDPADANNSSFISRSILDNLESKKTEDSTEMITKKTEMPRPTDNKSFQATIEVTEQKRGMCQRDRPHKFTNMPCECKGQDSFCRSCRGSGLMTERAVQRREMMQSLVKQALHQELPNIVNSVKQQLGQPSEMPPMKIEEPMVNKPVHQGVTCDLCEMCPIVGVRYKCTVMDNFDLCESCEAIIDHPYPMLKIKTEAQNPIQVITVMSDNAYPVQGFVSQPSEEIQGLMNNLLSTIAKKEDETPGQSNETPGESKEEETPGFDGMFVKEISMIPSMIEMKDLTVYKTISLRNNGMSAWPKNCFIESEGEVMGETCKLPSVDAGKDFSTVLIIRSPMKAGQFQSKWRFAYTDSNGMKKEFGTGFVVEFNIAGEKVEENLFAEPVMKFAPEVMEKAKAVMEIFSQVNFEECCEYIEHDPSKTIEDLIEDYMSLIE